MKLFTLFLLPSLMILFGMNAYACEDEINDQEDQVIKTSQWDSLQDNEVMEKATRTIREAGKAIGKIMSPEDSRIPPALFENCEGLVIFPGAFKVAVGALGGQGGRGIAMIRKGDGSWSNPFFIWMSEGSVGAQIGAQSSDIVLLFKNRKNIMRMEEAEIKLGGDIIATAGPENKEISAGTDITFESEIYSYSRSKGLFAGVSVSGAILIYNGELNDVFYDQIAISVDEIFYQIQTPYNPEVMKLIETLNNYAGYNL